MMELHDVRFDENGLVPVVVREASDGTVLMLAYANTEALRKTLETSRATFWSRSRSALWEKGETSGNQMAIRRVAADCDSDAVLYEVEATGPACHTGARSCFFRELGDRRQTTGDRTEDSESRKLRAESPELENFELERLFAVLKRRFKERPEGSYSARIFEKGLDHILKKIGEEASEVIVAMKNPDDAALAGEIADLLYHLCAAMTARGISATVVNSALAARRRQMP